MLSALGPETLSLDGRLEIFDECGYMLGLLVQAILIVEKGEDTCHFTEEHGCLGEVGVQWG